MRDSEWGDNPEGSGVLHYDAGLSFNDVHDLFHYREGHLYWNLNGLPAGRPTKQGYIRVLVKGQYVMEHRLIFLGQHGFLPDDGEIDHIDRDRGNNRVENLRSCTRSDNLRNRAPYKHRKLRSRQEGKVWKAVPFVLALISWIVYVQIASRSPEALSRDEQTRQHLEDLLANQICNDQQWASYPKQCEEMAKEERGRNVNKLPR